MELDKSGEVQKRYIRGNDLIYADKGTDTDKKYYVTDPHGNVVQLTDENGKVVKTYEYDSFGNEVKADKKDDNPFRYCGEYYDKETEEIYLRARYYQPSVGRFITRDTYTGEDDEPLSLHLYTYCANDGVNAWDPRGNKTVVGEKPMAGISVLLDKYYRSMQNKPTPTPKPTPKPNKVYALASSDTGIHYKSLNEKKQLANAKYIKQYLQNKGWTLNAICGVLGNIYKECGMNPGHWQVWNNTKLAYGLLQWDDATKFLDNTAKGKLEPKDVNSLAEKKPKVLMDLQLKFFVQTMGGKHNQWLKNKTFFGCEIMEVKKYIKSKRSVTKLAYIFHGSYERSGDPNEKIKERGAAAEKYYKKLKHK